MAAFSSAIREEHVSDIVTLVGTLRDWKAKLNPSSGLDIKADTSGGTLTGLEGVEWGSDLVLKDPFEVG